MFKAGDKVAWSHSIATQHAAGSILKVEAVKAGDAASRFGVVSKIDIAPEVAEGETPEPCVGRRNIFEVTFDEAEGETAEVRELTADELVQVA